MSERSSASERRRVRRRGATAAVLGTAAAAGAGVLARMGVEPFPQWLYQIAWYGVLAAAAGALAWRDGEAPLTVRQAASLLFWSVPFWYLFEAANLRLANWYYVLVPADGPVRWVGSAVAFATVLPALHLAHRWISRTGLASGWRTPAFPVRTVHLAATAGLGGAFVGLSLWRPDLFFPLIWGALTLLVEPWNYRRAPASSLLGDLARGRPARPVRLLAGGLVVGLVWETLNASAGARWIYTVPGLEGAKLFEMPLPGYLGFPVLALDAFVAYRGLAHLGVAARAWAEGDRGPETGAPGGLLRRRTVLAAIAALALSAAAQAGVDRWTVDSVRPTLVDLPGVDAPAASALREAGVDGPRALAEADSARLAGAGRLSPETAGAAVRSARLAELRGLGAANAAALWSTGIRSVCDLAASGQVEVSDAVRRHREGRRAGHRPRVRVWLRAAREKCPCGC